LELHQQTSSRNGPSIQCASTATHAWSQRWREHNQPNGLTQNCGRAGYPPRLREYCLQRPVRKHSAQRSRRRHTDTRSIRRGSVGRRTTGAPTCAPLRGRLSYVPIHYHTQDLHQISISIEGLAGVVSRSTTLPRTQNSKAELLEPHEPPF